MKHPLRLGTVLLSFTIAAVTLAGALFFSYSRQGFLLPKIQYGFYTTNMVVRYVGERFSLSRFWHAVERSPAKNFAVYRTHLAFGSDVRGVYLHGEMERPPLAQGRFFTPEEMKGEELLAVIGKGYTAQTYEADGKTWIDLLDTRFEVIGVVGLETASLLDLTQWIPLGTAFALRTQMMNYKLDANTADDMRGLTSVLDPVFKTQRDAKIDEEIRAGRRLSGLRGSLAKMNNITKLYCAMVVSFSVTMLFSALYWVCQKDSMIRAYHLLGFSRRIIFGKLLADYGKTALFAAIVGALPLPFLLRAQSVPTPTLAQVLALVGILALPGAAVCLLRMQAVLRAQTRK